MARLVPISLAALTAAATLLSGCATPPDRSSAGPAEPAAASAAPKAAAPADKLFTLPYEQRELGNGLRVIVVRTPHPGTVSLQIPVQTGSRNEIEPGKSGFAHFFEHMMFRGTPNHSAEEYAAAMKAAGADQNAYTDDDYTNYYLNFTVEDLPKVLELEADRFQNLSYSEEQFRTEAQAVKGEYLKNYANPLLKGFERMQDNAFMAHTYKHTTMGFFKDIEDMPNQLEYSKTFFARWYRPEYATVIVAGDVEPKATIDLVAKHFGKWQRGDYRVQVPVEPPQAAAKYEHVAWEGPTLPWILIGFHGPAFSTTEPDSAALTLLAEVYFGETSPLYQQLVVEKQWVDQFYAGAPRNRDPGLFGIGARLTKPEHAAEVTRAIQDALLEARTRPIADSQLAKVKSRLKYGFAAGMDSAASIAGILAQFVHYERDVETLNRYYRVFDAVTAGQVLDVANRVFTDSNRTVISIANAPSLAGANEFRPIDALAAEQRGKLEPRASEAEVEPVVDEHTARDRARSAQLATAWAANEASFTVTTLEQRSDSPLVDVSLLFRTGAAADPPGKSGLAELTAAMITEGGSENRTYEQVQRALYPLAAPFVAQVDKEMTTFGGTVHRDNLDRWWDVAGEQLMMPGFREEDFKRLQQQQINAIRVNLRANNDEELGKELLYERVYGPGHVYGRLNLGRASEVAALTLDDVRTFYREQLTRGGLTLGLAGGYDDAFRERLLASTMRLGWKRLTPLAAPLPRIGTQSQALVVQKETPAVAVSFGWPLALKRGDPDWVAMWLVRSWLGEHRSFSGRLYNRIREVRGMNYGNYAYIEYFPNGMYLMKPQPNHARQNDLFQIWLRPLRSNNDAMFATRAALFEIDRLRKNGLSATDFESTRSFLRKYAAQLVATPSQRLGYALDSQYYGTPEFVDYVRAGLEALTLDQVNAAIRKHLAPQAMQFVYITRDAAGLADALRERKPSPIEYNTTKPAELLAEDKVIATWPMTMSHITIVKESEVFE
jgi:zinc protease